MGQANTHEVNQTINKTLMVARLIDGFWDRWIVHGVCKEDLMRIRPHLSSKEQWINIWSEYANRKVEKALAVNQENNSFETELLLRTAGLYYQLAQWLLVERSDEKLLLLDKSVNTFMVADQYSTIPVNNEVIHIDSYKYYGRVRIPADPKGVLVFINPMDSAKEELFTYEMDIASRGYVTISFDGPGQGQTYALEGVKATKARWEHFVEQLISYAHIKFPHLKIYLFGTSSGASWALYGGRSPFVTKVVAVSPAMPSKDLTLPDYFVERMASVIDSEADILPDLDEMQPECPVLLVHGKQDVMVSEEAIYRLYEQLPDGKKLLEYEDEGHCCNYKLPVIRQRSVDWFQSEDGV